MRISCRRILFFLILINPFLSLIFDNTSVYYFYIMGPAVFLLLLYYNCKSGKYGKTSLAVSFSTVLSVILAVAYGASQNDLGKINNHLFNFLDAVLLLLMLSQDENIEYFKNLMLEKMRFIKLIIIVVNIVELVLLISGSGYEYRYSWGGTFFRGTNSMPHTLSYLMLVIIILDCVVIQYTRNRLYGVFCIVPFYAIFESGARTTLILSLFMLLVVIDLVFTQKQKSLFFKVIFVVVIAAGFLYLFRDKILSSDLWSKILLRQASGNDTAGRTYIWTDLLERYFTSFNPIKYLFGQGDYMTYNYNLVNPKVKASVWAHNDFIQILMGKGLVGVIFYVYALTKCIKNIIVKNKSVYRYAIVLMVIVAAMINGFYSYRDIILSLPFIVILARFYDSRRELHEQTITNTLRQRKGRL